MPTYVVLYTFTDAGAKNIKGTVQRARESRAENERRGFTVHGLYWTQGQYDMVAIVEAPDEQAMLERPISDLNLSVRARKCMARLGLTLIGELLRKTGDDLLECKNFGVTSLTEVREKLTTMGLKLRGD